jgi:hypothetical protein
MGERRKEYGLMVGKPEGMEPLRRPISRWVDNIKMELVNIVRGDVELVGLAMDREKWGAFVNSG